MPHLPSSALGRAWPIANASEPKLDQITHDATKPSMIDKLRIVAFILVIAAAAGIAFYLTRPWQWHALVHIVEIAYLVVWSKAAAKVAIFIGGGAAALWAGIRALRERFRSS